MKEFPPIDEKIASGLMKQFWAEMVHRQNVEFGRAADFNVNKKLISKVKGKGSWLEQLKRIGGFFESTNLLTYIGGTERRPYLGLMLLYALKEREYNSWNERCLTALVLLTAPNPMFSQNYISLFNIGEHAISRLFLRKPSHERHGNGLVKIDSILDDIRPLGAWAAFWHHRLVRNKQLYDHRDQLSPIVPSPSGLFLCRFSQGPEAQLEVRTFIGKSDFKKSQEKIHDLLSSACEGFLVSPLAFSPFVEKLGYDYPKLLTQIMCLRLVSHAEDLGKQLVEKIEDRALASSLKSELVTTLEREKGPVENDDLLSKVGLESFLEMGRNAAQKDVKTREFLVN